MVICGVFLQLFLKVRSAVLLAEQGKFHVLQGYGVLIKSGNLIFVRTDIHHIALVVEVTERVQFHKLLSETPRIAAAVNIARPALYQIQKVDKLLHGGRVGQMPLHLLGGHIGKV